METHYTKVYVTEKQSKDLYDYSCDIKEWADELRGIEEIADDVDYVEKVWLGEVKSLIEGYELGCPWWAGISMT